MSGNLGVLIFFISICLFFSQCFKYFSNISSDDEYFYENFRWFPGNWKRTRFLMSYIPIIPEIIVIIMSPFGLIYELINGIICFCGFIADEMRELSPPKKQIKKQKPVDPDYIEAEKEVEEMLNRGI